MREVKAVEWVVYRMTMTGKHTGMLAVCEQGEWDAMELAQPGQHTLIQDHIADEGAAERLARGTSGDARYSTNTDSRLRR
jgi:hypothetical protein